MCIIQLHELPIDINRILSALLINILLGSFSLFLHSSQPLSGALINSAVSASQRLHYPRRKRSGFTRTD